MWYETFTTVHHLWLASPPFFRSAQTGSSLSLIPLQISVPVSVRELRSTTTFGSFRENILEFLWVYSNTFQYRKSFSPEPFGWQSLRHKFEKFSTEAARRCPFLILNLAFSAFICLSLQPSCVPQTFDGFFQPFWIFCSFLSDDPSVQHKCTSSCWIVPSSCLKITMLWIFESIFHQIISEISGVVRRLRYTRVVLACDRRMDLIFADITNISQAKRMFVAVSNIEVNRFPPVEKAKDGDVSYRSCK